MNIVHVILLVFAFIAVYLNGLATLGVVYDHELSLFQKTSQLLFVEKGDGGIKN